MTLPIGISGEKFFGMARMCIDAKEKLIKSKSINIGYQAELI